MSDEADPELTEDEAQRRQLRLLGVGTVASGLLVIGVSAVSPAAYEILVYGLGALGIGALVLERTEGARVGVSLGFLTAGVIVWFWPFVGGSNPDYTFVGGVLVLVGILNVVGAPIALYFRRLGERAGERTKGD